MALRGKVALVTGSSRGIGAAIAEALAREGARVIVNANRSVDAGEAVAARIRRAHGRDASVMLQADCSSEAGCQQLVREAVAWSGGRLDHLVINHGINKLIPHTDLDAIDEGFLRRVFDANVFGPFYLTRAAMPHLQRGEGDHSILITGSVAGLRPVGSSIVYAMTKAAVHHMVRLIAKSFGPRVRCNAIAPGLIDTELARDLIESGAKAAIEATIPAARVGVPEDCVPAAMAAITSTYMTGVVIEIDGGLCAKL